jgi:hypothetical protein
MEARFGHDFADVKIHSDYAAGAAARAVDARAFTVGSDVVFAQGQYDPASFDGKVLLAHELTHVVQQRAYPAEGLDRPEVVPASDPSESEADTTSLRVVTGGGPGAAPHATGRTPRRLARASFKIGGTTVNIDYGGPVQVPVGDYVKAIEAAFTSWTAGDPAPIHNDLVALGRSAQEWMLFALDLLADNPVATLDRPLVARRLIEYAAHARFQPLRDSKPGFWSFENEVLMVSGWFEKALTSSLKAPTGPYLTAAQKAIGSGGGADPGSSACPSPRPANQMLDETKLRADLPPQLEARLKAAAPPSGLKAQPIATLRSFGDIIQGEAETFFSPYANNARGTGNLTLEGWKYSANVVESTSPAAAPSPEKRVALMENRARLVGDKGLFATVHFDARCDADAAVLTDIVEKMEKVATIGALADAILQHSVSYTLQDANPKRVVLNTDIPSNADACAARWKTVEGMCHELVHVMAHDDFRANVAGRQVLREGFTEVLGDQLYSRIASKARLDKTFQSPFEAAVPGSPCSDIPSSTLGYGEAGKNAETLRVIVKDDRFRAAYFLGELELVGIRRKRMAAGSRGALEDEAIAVETSIRDDHEAQRSGACDGTLQRSAAPIELRRQKTPKADPKAEPETVTSGRPGVVVETTRNGILVRFFVRAGDKNLADKIRPNLSALTAEIAKLNGMMADPKAAVTQLFIWDGATTGFRIVLGRATVYLDTKYAVAGDVGTVTHEVGHAIIDSYSRQSGQQGGSAEGAAVRNVMQKVADLYLQLKQTKTATFGELGIASDVLPKDRSVALGHYMVDTSNWTKSREAEHPWDNFDEFFASAFEWFSRDREGLNTSIAKYSKKDAKIKPLGKELIALLEAIQTGKRPTKGFTIRDAKGTEEEIDRAGLPPTLVLKQEKGKDTFVYSAVTGSGPGRSTPEAVIRPPLLYLVDPESLKAPEQKRRGSEEPIQRREIDASGPETAPPVVHEVLRSSGRPLDSATRSFMEPRFGHDFSRVRVHTSAAAADSAMAVNALAYTVGTDVVFGAGRYDPESASGRRLLAHELAHVVQQSRGDHRVQPASIGSTRGIPVGAEDDELEREADQAADKAMRGEDAASPAIRVTRRLTSLAAVPS